MKSYREELTFNLPARMDFANITPQVEAALDRSCIQDGLLLCNAMHITASVFINDDEPGLHADIERWVQKLAPGPAADDSSAGPDYQHHHSGEDNGDAHLKNLLIGHQVIVPVTAGKLDFGPWEQIFYGEFDGKRAKRVLIKVIGD